MTDIERLVRDSISEHIVSSRPQRAAQVQACMEGLERVDDLTRLVASICIRHYIDTAKPEDSLSVPRFMNRRRARYMAPGIFMADRDLHDAILGSGEFVSPKMLRGGARALELKSELGTIAAEFLFQWAAARHPDSRAAEMVDFYGLRSGRMAHDMNKGRYFNTEALLFHESVPREYLDTVTAGSSLPHARIDAVICLAVTDDWERATSLLPQRRPRRRSA